MATSFDLDEWRRALESRWVIPESGSELDCDDALLPDGYVSSTAAEKLTGSLEHLQYFYRSEYQDAVSAPYTVLRAALAAATQALWVVGPNDQITRVKRALRLTVEDMTGLRRYARALDELGEFSPQGQSSSLSGWGARLAKDTDRAEQEVLKAAAKLGIAKYVQARVNTTDLVVEAARYMPKADAHLGALLRMLWRSNSGHAHVGGFARSLDLVARNISQYDDHYEPETGWMPMPIQGDRRGQVATATMAAAILQTSLRIFGKRRSHPPPSLIE